MATDKINLIFNLEKEKFNCSKKFPNQCIEYFTALIMTRNRIKDYSVTFNETLKVPKDNFLFEEFNKLIGISNLVAKKSFGLSFEEAKNLGIVTPKEYISNIKKNQISQASFKSTSEIFLKSITKLYNQIDAFKDNEIKNLKPVNQLRELNLTFYILVYLKYYYF